MGTMVGHPDSPSGQRDYSPSCWAYWLASLSCHPLCKLPSNEGSSFTPGRGTGGRGSPHLITAQYGGNSHAPWDHLPNAPGFPAPHSRASRGAVEPVNANLASASLPSTTVDVESAPWSTSCSQSPPLSVLGTSIPSPSSSDSSAWLLSPLKSSPSFSKSQWWERPDFSCSPIQARFISACVFSFFPTWGILHPKYSLLGIRLINSIKMDSSEAPWKLI